MVILPYELTKTLFFNVYNPLPIRLIADYYIKLKFYNEQDYNPLLFFSVSSC